MQNIDSAVTLHENLKSIIKLKASNDAAAAKNLLETFGFSSDKDLIQAATA